MTQSDDGNTESSRSPDMTNESWDLFARLCDGELSEIDRDRLNQILNESTEARHHYLRYIAVHTGLGAISGSPIGCSSVDAQLAVERLTLEQFAGHLDTAPLHEFALWFDRGARARSAILWAASLAAALLVAGTTWWSIQRLGRQEDPARPVVSESHSMPDDDVSRLSSLVAEVTYVSNSITWHNPNGSFALASRVQAGQSLSLLRGQIELTYASGAKMLLTGPAEFLVEPKGGKLHWGELVARVPEAGHGFTIETPHGKVVDLGTEFGVVVDDFGVSQVSVFEGKVETTPTGIFGVSQNTIELTSGRAIQWTDRAVIPIDVRGRRYQHASEDLPIKRVDRSSKASTDNDFRGRPLVPGQWKTLGDVTESKGGLRLGGSASTSQRPYLLTAQEFDPARGAITVVCDLRFENVRDAEHASCAVLTRCADQLSKRGTAMQDMLARSVRCRLNADPASGEGMLEADAKYEADREQTKISWGGFSRPLPDTLYRLEMRDDGLNVSFTVSLADNPSVSKTIACRSLFRGNQNFVALEGPSSGTAVIERLMISQDAPSIDQNSSLSSQITGTTPKSGSREDKSAMQLAALAPADAELVLTDDFDGDELKPANWTTRGEVVVQNGQVQLGMPNDEQHIDTWKVRPYLLTKDRFDLSNQTLTVVGKATFAENYLNGYGGSFAVMTRAENAYGGGAGWESSILRRGVRANFWPAAYGFDHSLEIQEKPEPNSISLLVAEGFPIAPKSRSYLFQVIDDGRTATLTFIDTSNPSICKTVSRPTTSSRWPAGHIAFEGCWGSPVELDNVRIYRSRDSE